MTRPVDAVLFDLDGTLVEYERPPEEVLRAAFELAGVESSLFTVEEYYAYYDDLVGADVSDIREHCFAAITADRGHDPEIGRAVAAAYAELRDHRRVRTLAGARELVTSFAGEYAVGLVTNGPPDYQQPKLDATEFADAFESVVFAGYDTAAKPDPEPFERALFDLDTAPERAVYVGNSVEADVAGAAAAGLRSVWLDDGSEPDPVPDHAIDSLADLLAPPWP